MQWYIHRMTNDSHRLGFLDGLRGLAALWVLLGHMAHFSQWTLPLISKPGYAVDLFMLISGFLMFYQAQIRAGKEPMDDPHSWILFWIRRFFRIAPLFYIALLASFLIGPYLADSWVLVREAYGKEGDTLRFLDQSFTNIALHYSFLFGLFPDYETRTALPDWSISLEMQFYVLFPFLFVFMCNTGPIKMILSFFALCLCWDYLYTDALTGFDQPSFIVLKLHIFVAGMLVAAAYFSTSKRMVWGLAIAAVLLGILPFSFQILPRLSDAGIILTLIALALSHKMGLPTDILRGVEKISTTLGNRFFHFLGEMSYGVYLIHFFITIPVCAYLLANHGDLSSPVRFFTAVLICLPVTYGIAYLLHVTVEQPGIAWGRNIVKNLQKFRENRRIYARNA